MIMIQTIEYLATFVEALLGITINAKTLYGKNLKIQDNIIASFMIAFVVWMMNQLWIFSVLNTLIGIMGIVVGSCLIYKIKMADSIALTAVYLLLVYIVDFLSVALFGVAMQDTQFANAMISKFSYARLGCLVFDKMLLCSAYLILDKKCLSKIQLPLRKLVVGLILTCFFSYIMVKSTFTHINTDTFFMWFLFLLMFLSILYLTMRILSYIQESNRMAMAIERSTLLADTYKKEIQHYRNEQVFYHDLKNQLLVIESYIRNKKYDKAEEYLGKIGIAEMDTPEQRTGIEVLDILLDYKKKEAEKQRIRVDIMTESIRLKLAEHEIVALFGNLFDNAVEACNQVRDDIRWIRIVIRGIQDMTFIKISNSCTGKPILESGRFVSTKRDKRMHGFGMDNMKLIVEKYDGTIEVDYDEESFSVMISFFY